MDTSVPISLFTTLYFASPSGLKLVSATHIGLTVYLVADQEPPQQRLANATATTTGRATFILFRGLCLQFG